MEVIFAGPTRQDLHDGDVISVSSVNYDAPEIVILKQSETGMPLSGGIFEVKIDDRSLGEFTTDGSGKIVISYDKYGDILDPDQSHWTVEVREKFPPDGSVALNAQKQAQLDVAAETESARAEAKKAVEQLRAENAQIAADLKLSREREQAEYDYDLKRRRQVEADKFVDETAALDKKCAEKRAELASLTEDADRILAMQARIECLDEELEAKYQAGYADGEKAAGKEYGIKTSMTAKEHDFELRDRDGQIARLTDDVEEKAAKIRSLEEKLDKAYSQLRDMAVKTVESSGGVKIIGTSDTGSGRK